jgi:hypothetical protein
MIPRPPTPAAALSNADRQWLIQRFYQTRGGRLRRRVRPATGLGRPAKRHGSFIAIYYGFPAGLVDRSDGTDVWNRQ